MSAVLTILKNSTNQLHGKLEQVSYAREIMTKQLSSEQYQELLVKNYLVYQRLEPQLNQGLKKVGRLFSQRFSSRRLRDIENDLDFFLMKKPKVAHQPIEVIFDCPSSCLGVLYVMEGARLGGNVIVKALKNNAQLKEIPDFHFFQQKEINIRKRWIGFQKAANDYILTEENLKLATSAAQKTFQYFYEAHRSKVC